MPYKDPEKAADCKRKHYLRNRDKYLADSAGRWREDDGTLEAQRRVSHLKTRYGITETQYCEMLRKQGDRCAICLSKDPQGGRRFLCVDHDHSTGKVRGLLCQSCNILVSYAENPRLTAALEYLKKAGGRL